jgi:hypothetical protein
MNIQLINDPEKGIRVDNGFIPQLKAKLADTIIF